MSEVPTLVVSHRPRGPFRRALVAVEIDASVRSLIELTCHLLSGVDAGDLPVRIVHAYKVPFAGWHRAAGDASAAYYTRHARQAAERSLAKLLTALHPHPCTLHPVVRSGDPQGVIAREATRCRADLVAVGSHGRSGIAHALLGSIAESVVAQTRRDVLVARPVRFTFVPP